MRSKLQHQAWHTGRASATPVRYTMAMKSGAVSPKSYAMAKWRSGLIERQISEGGKGCLNDQQRMEVNKTGG